jgi:hypothetical protein
MRPSGNAAKEHEDEDHKENGADHWYPFLQGKAGLSFCSTRQMLRRERGTEIANDVPTIACPRVWACNLRLVQKPKSHSGRMEVQEASLPTTKDLFS